MYGSADKDNTLPLPGNEPRSSSQQSVHHVICVIEKRRKNIGRYSRKFFLTVLQRLEWYLMQAMNALPLNHPLVGRAGTSVLARHSPAPIMHLTCCYEYVHIAQLTDVRISCRGNHIRGVACQSVVIQFDAHGHCSV
jgi:hypothetical protein